METPILTLADLYLLADGLDEVAITTNVVRDLTEEERRAEHARINAVRAKINALMNLAAV